MLDGDTVDDPGVHTADRLDTDALRALLLSYAQDRSRWAPLVQFHAERRWWTRLHADAAADVWLPTWMTDQVTELHDHGGSLAAFTVVQGALQELRVRDGVTTSAGCTPGTVRHVAPDVVHDVRNLEAAPAVSVHAYSPPLTSMTYYRQEASGLLATHTLTGAEPESAR